MMTGRIYYVSKQGLDSGSGSVSEPFFTIQKAADMMQPGDKCIIGEGIYREWIKPPRGGSNEYERITYTAAEGEKVVIKGSEQITSWIHWKEDIWKVDISDSFFGDFNPFKLNVSGGWLIFGHEYHLGEVYLNDEAYCEKLHLNEVLAASGTWFTEGTETTTSIYANFGGINPNSSLAEINVRECIFFPIVKGLRYITIDGLSMVQAAANWVNFTDFQHAAVGTYYGKSWIIENCYISDAKCAGLVCGNNIFVKKGTDQLLNARDFKVGWNVYYQGARKAYWGEDNSIVNESFHADVQIQTLRNGVKILFLADDSPRNVLCPHITHDFIGIYQLTGQGLEDHDGNPIDIDIDILGSIRDSSHPLAGPLDQLESGENAIILKVGPTAVAYNDKS